MTWDNFVVHNVNNALGPVYIMDHEIGPWKMVFFPWSDLMVQHPWSNFLKKSICKALGSSLGVNQNVDQEE